MCIITPSRTRAHNRYARPRLLYAAQRRLVQNGFPVFQLPVVFCCTSICILPVSMIWHISTRAVIECIDTSTRDKTVWSLPCRPGPDTPALPPHSHEHPSRPAAEGQGLARGPSAPVPQPNTRQPEDAARKDADEAQTRLNPLFLRL